MSHFSRLQFSRFAKADEGQALVLIALGLMMLMLVAGFGIDVGYLRYQKEQMQKAADAAAIAAATALSYHGDYRDAGLNDAASNGFKNGTNDVTVAVNNPPAAGDPFAGNANYVQVIVSRPIPTFFMRFASLGLVNVSSHAVANAAGLSSGCLYALDPVDSGTFLVDANVSLGVTCGIYVNSSSSAGLQVNLASGSISVNGPRVGIGVVGSNYVGEGVVPNPTLDIPSFTDPLITLPTPSYNPTCAGPIISNQLNPGTYCGGIQLRSGGPFTSYTLKPGMYVLLGGGLTIDPSIQVSGTGVFFYVTGNGTYPYGGVNIGGSSTTNLSSLTSGTYAGILFFQDRSVPTGSAASTFDESNGAVFTGTLYFPTTQVRFKGTPGIASYNPIVAWAIDVQGTATIKDNFLPNNGSPIPGATLVE